MGDTYCRSLLSRRLRSPVCSSFAILLRSHDARGCLGRQSQVSERPVGVEEGAYGARYHEKQDDHDQDGWRAHGDERRPGGVCNCKRDRRYEQDEGDDRDHQDKRDPDPYREPELYEPEQQAPSDVVAEETVAAPDGAEDALPAHHDVPQGVLADDGEGDKDDDEHKDGQNPHHYRDGDPRPRGLGGRERAPDQKRHGYSYHHEEPERDQEEHDVVAEHAPEVTRPGREGGPEAASLAPVYGGDAIGQRPLGDYRQDDEEQRDK